MVCTGTGDSVVQTMVPQRASLLAKLRDRLFQMCIRMIDTDSSCDDVEHMELNSMVELVSLPEEESEGPVSLPHHRHCTHGPTRRS